MKDYSYVKGFNYQPGYAYNSYETWRFFDAKVFRSELSNGKAAFPGFNTVRYWLSYDAFRYEEDRQAANFETALSIADSLGLKVVPVLFNRWHDYNMDNGGIYIDQMVTESNWCSRGSGLYIDSYIQKIVAAHLDDERILVWDYCNEPYSYGSNKSFTDIIRPLERQWLTLVYGKCKETGARQPISFSPCSDSPAFLREHNDICDVFLIHMYRRNVPIDDIARNLINCRLTAEELGKGVITTETCWGSTDDEERIEIIRLELGAHNMAKVGYIAHALAYSHVADLHNAEDGVVGGPGNLCFLDKDGTVRKGHEIFNNY